MITLKAVYRFNENKRLKKDGTAPVCILAYQKGGKRKYFPTGISVEPKQWDDKKFIIKHPRHRELNGKLREQLNTMNSFILEKEKRYLPINLQILGDYDNANIDLSFTQFYENQVEASSNGAGSKRDQLQTLSYLKKIRPIIYFNELTKAFVHRFEASLVKKGLGTNTIAKHHKNLKKFINLAIDFEYMDLNKNPYRGYQVKRQPTERIFLRLSEVEQLERLTFEPDKKHLELTRDFFLFSCWTGLRKSDMMALRPKHFISTPEGFFYQKITVKTKKPHILKLNKLFGGKPERLIKKYLLDYDDIYTDDPDRPVSIFMTRCEQVINRQLKTLATLANLRTDIQEKISIHTARHTFGTVMAGKVEIPVLQKLMQHSKIKETMIYVHLNQNMINEALDRIDWEK